jgi:hypothetical protein
LGIFAPPSNKVEVNINFLGAHAAGLVRRMDFHALNAFVQQGCRQLCDMDILSDLLVVARLNRFSRSRMD